MFLTPINYPPGITSLPNEILIKIITLVPLDDNVTAIGLSCKALAALTLQSIYFARIHIRIQLNIAETALISQYLQDRAVKDKRWCAFPVPYKLAIYELLLINDPRPDTHDPRDESEIQFWAEVVGEEKAEDFEDPSLREDMLLCINWPLTQLQAMQLTKAFIQSKDFDLTRSCQHLFFWAVESGHVECVKLLLAECTAVNPGVDQNWPLLIASREGHLEIIRILLRDIRVNPSIRRFTLFRFACEMGHTDLVKLILQDERIKLSIRAINSAFENACASGNLDIAEQLLLDSRVDSKQIQSALQFAVHWGYLKSAAILLKHPGVVPNSSYVRDAMRNKDIEMAKLLLRDPRLDPASPFESDLRSVGISSELYHTMISLAASEGLTEIVELLLVHPRMAGKSDGFNAALWYATSSGNCEILKLLLKDGRANPTEGQTFSMACSQGNDQVVRLYLEDGRLDPSMNNQEALIHACWYEKLNIAKILVEDPRVDLETALNRLESIPQQSFNNKRKVIDLLKTFKKKGA